jgi:hypothetical protein
MSTAWISPARTTGGALGPPAMARRQVARTAFRRESATSCAFRAGKTLKHVGAYLRPQRVDRSEPPTGFDVPESPAVAGLEALGDGTDPVD